MRREELAWAAGFFDGEGYAGTRWGRSRVRRYPVPALTISQNETTTLERFRAAVGGLGRVSRRSTNPRGGAEFAWATTNWREAQTVIALLWRYLSGPKRDQASPVLRRWKEHVASGRWEKPFCLRGHDRLVAGTLYTSPKGKRHCRLCASEQARERRARRTA